MSSSYLTDDAGNPSMMRLAVLVIVVVLLINLTWVTIATNSIQKDTWQILIGLVGSLWAKQAQKSKESKEGAS